MVDYVFNSVIDQVVTFFPAADRIQFTGIDATGVSIAQTTDNRITLTTSSGTVTIDSNAVITPTNAGIFTTSNVTFSDSSLLVVGDNTIDDTLDGNANLIDFVNDASFSSALNRDNQVHGLGGNDTINFTGSTGDQLLFGGDDNDTIYSGNGDSTLFGGSSTLDTVDGADNFVIGSGSNVIYGNAGDDTVSFSSATASGETLTFFGGTGADSFSATGAAGTMVLNGGAGADTIVSQSASGSQTITGGGDGDSIDLSNSTGQTTVFGGTGTADSSDGGDTIIASSGSTTIYANAGTDSVVANNVNSATATFYLGSGADSLSIGTSNGNITAFGNADSDVLDISGHQGNATLFGGGGTSDANDGADTITSGSFGSQLIYGNAGADSITANIANSNSVTVYAGADADTILAAATGNGTSALYGNAGADQFQFDFTSFATALTAKDFGNGEDTLAVTLNGGAAAANLTVTRDSSGTTLSSGSAQIVLEGFTSNFTSTNTSFSDSSVLVTNYDGGAASLSGSDNNDQLIAGTGGDTLTAGLGNDSLRGGSGLDQFVFTTAGFDQNDTINGGAGTDTIAFGTPGTNIVDNMFANIINTEVVELTSGDFATNGITLGTNATNAGITTVNATAASAVTADFSAMQSAINYDGATASDVVTGTNFNDTIITSMGDDTLAGGLGADSLISGQGNDRFLYQNGINDAGDTISGVDFGTALTSTDIFQITDDVGAYNLGNNDDTVDGAILTEITSAGAIGTEVIILRNIGIATADIENILNTINNNAAAGDGVINLFYDTTRGNVVMYLDGNGGTAGGHVLLADFTNLTSLSDMDVIDFTDFAFV